MLVFPSHKQISTFFVSVISSDFVSSSHALFYSPSYIHTYLCFVRVLLTFWRTAAWLQILWREFGPPVIQRIPPEGRSASGGTPSVNCRPAAPCLRTAHLSGYNVLHSKRDKRQIATTLVLKQNVFVLNDTLYDRMTFTVTIKCINV